jgi:hypothetical protein
VIWFTLGNISVEGTYTTHALNLTPRGLLAVAVAEAVGRRPSPCPCRTIRNSRGVGSPSGTGTPVTIT